MGVEAQQGPLMARAVELTSVASMGMYLHALVDGIRPRSRSPSRPVEKCAPSAVSPRKVIGGVAGRRGRSTSKLALSLTQGLWEPRVEIGCMYVVEANVEKKRQQTRYFCYY